MVGNSVADHMEEPVGDRPEAHPPVESADWGLHLPTPVSVQPRILRAGEVVSVSIRDSGPRIPRREPKHPHLPYFGGSFKGKLETYRLVRDERWGWIDWAFKVAGHAVLVRYSTGDNGNFNVFLDGINVGSYKYADESDLAMCPGIGPALAERYFDLHSVIAEKEQARYEAHRRHETNVIASATLDTAFEERIRTWPRWKQIVARLWWGSLNLDRKRKEMQTKGGKT